MLAAACLFCGVAPVAAAPLPMGPAKVTVDVGLPLEVFTYKPPTYQGGPLIVVFHGVQRNAEDYRNFAITLAATSQTSDVTVSARPMRRLVLVQALLSFVFNTVVLALSINLGASLI